MNQKSVTSLLDSIDFDAVEPSSLWALAAERVNTPLKPRARREKNQGMSASEYRYNSDACISLWSVQDTRS
jgi:hypothetical protein